jgi:hypothetical protein
VTKAYICDSCHQISTITLDVQRCHHCGSDTHISPEGTTELPIPKNVRVREYANGPDYGAASYPADSSDAIKFVILEHYPAPKTEPNTPETRPGRLDLKVVEVGDKSCKSESRPSSSTSDKTADENGEFIIYVQDEQEHPDSPWREEKQEVDHASNEQEAEYLVREYQTAYGRNVRVWFENTRRGATGEDNLIVAG